jgi:hypothetical protein
MATTAAHLEIGTVLNWVTPPGQTGGGSKGVIAVNFATQAAVRQTESPAYAIKAPVITPEAPSPESARTPELTDEKTLARIKAVVSRIDGPSIAISLQLPSGPVDINVAADIVPGELARYGQPVWVSLDASDGYKRLIVRERNLDIPSSSDRLADLKRWVATLG